MRALRPGDRATVANTATRGVPLRSAQPMGARWVGTFPPGGRDPVVVLAGPVPSPGWGDDATDHLVASRLGVGWVKSWFLRPAAPGGTVP